MSSSGSLAALEMTAATSALVGDDRAAVAGRDLRPGAAGRSRAMGRVSAGPEEVALADPPGTPAGAEPPCIARLPMGFMLPGRPRLPSPYSRGVRKSDRRRLISFPSGYAWKTSISALDDRLTDRHLAAGGGELESKVCRLRRRGRGEKKDDRQMEHRWSPSRFAQWSHTHDGPSCVVPHAHSTGGATGATSPASSVGPRSVPAQGPSPQVACRGGRRSAERCRVRR